MIEVTLTGDDVLRARLEAMPSKVHDALVACITGEAMRLQAHVVQDKLQGQILNHITGNLQASIHNDTSDEGQRITGRVYSAGCNYAAIHEYGGQIKTRLGMGKGKPKVGGKAFAIMPERSFIRSSFADYRDQIIESMNVAVQKAIAA